MAPSGNLLFTFFTGILKLWRKTHKHQVPKKALKNKTQLFFQKCVVFDYVIINGFVAVVPDTHDSYGLLSTYIGDEVGEGTPLQKASMLIVEENNFNKWLRGTRLNSLFENVRMSAASHSGYKIIIAIKFVQPLTVCGHGIYLKKIPL